MPAYANERRKNCGKTSSAESAMATVMPENTTVRPAVATERMTASCGVSPRPSCSRKRVTMNSA